MASGKSGSAEIQKQQGVSGAPGIVVLRPWLSERIWGCTELAVVSGAAEAGTSGR